MELDDLIAEVLGFRPQSYGPADLNISSGGPSSGAGTGGGRSRGIPGYPVPPEMKPMRHVEGQEEEEPVGFIDLVRSMVSEAVEEAPGVDAGAAKALLVRHKAALARHSVRLPIFLRSLGTGQHGTAFDLGDRVIKVTNDRREALAALKLKGLRLRHVVRVFDVFRFNEPTLVYAVVQEKLKPLQGIGPDPKAAVSGEAGEFNQAIVTTGLPVWLNAAHGDWDAAYQKMVDHISRKEEREPGFSQKAGRAYALLTQRFHLKDIFEELKGAGVLYFDFHAGNLMKRGSEYVVIDPGVSKIPGGGSEPEMLERRLSEGTKESPCVTLGAYRPFSKGDAKTVRELTRTHSRVVLCILPGEPLSEELVRDMVHASLPDVSSKLQVLFVKLSVLPQMLKMLTAKGQAVDVSVPGIAAKEVHDMMDDTGLVRVEERDETQADRDRQHVNQSFHDDDFEAFSRHVDPHLVSDRAKAEELFGRLRKDASGGLHELFGSTAAQFTQPGNATLSMGDSGWSRPLSKITQGDVEEPGDPNLNLKRLQTFDGRRQARRQGHSST